jgi:Fur family ferric uptake transcriptional regulator
MEVCEMTLDILRRELKKRGQRITYQRELILKIFMESENSHFGAEEIYRLLLEKRSRISKATVYRTLSLLADFGILNKIEFGDGIVRYELASFNGKSHNHLICKICGKVVEFESDKIDELIETISKETKYKIDNYQVKFYGICPDCFKKMLRDDDNQKIASESVK